MLLLSFAVYLVTLLLLLSEVDRQYYQVEKESIIKFNFRELFAYDTAGLQDISKRILIQYGSQGYVDADLKARWRAIAQSMIGGEGCVFRIRIVPRNGEQVIEQRDDKKFKRLNSFANTLFYRNFQNVVSYEIPDAAGNPWIGLLSFHYTTPLNYHPIVSLTNRYRLWALLLFGAVTACYGYVVGSLILPMKRVVDRIDDASASTPKTMLNPLSPLEKAYNSLARDAILLRLGQSIRKMMAEDPRVDRSVLIARIPRLLTEMLDYRAVLVCELSLKESGEPSISACFESVNDSRASDYKRYCIENVFRRENMQRIIGASRVDLAECFVADITQPPDRPYLDFLVVFPQKRMRKLDAATRMWHLRTIDQLVDGIRDIIVAFDLNKRYILRERSKANINLARNLGHDLTNIIATSKLDILTLIKLLEEARVGEEQAEDRDAVLLETSRSLLNNARLLQEIVNIYRSFSYINRPRLEEVRIDGLLDEIVDFFSLSLPAGIVLRKGYARDLPACTVEPRLLKLALFNLLTNAVEAINRRTEQAPSSGVITVSAGTDAANGEVWMSVRDNGTGILNEEGRAASDAEIDRIFRHGFTTKVEDASGGLGLSWVWTIIEEFHNGRIRARNNPDGGAEFSLFIRPETAQPDGSGGVEKADATPA